MRTSNLLTLFKPSSSSPSPSFRQTPSPTPPPPPPPFPLFHSVILFPPLPPQPLPLPPLPLPLSPPIILPPHTPPKPLPLPHSTPPAIQKIQPNLTDLIFFLSAAKRTITKQKERPMWDSNPQPQPALRDGPHRRAARY